MISSTVEVTKSEAGRVSALAVTGGDVVYAAAPFEASPAPFPPVSPSWSPVAIFGGCQRGT